ncbi:hypothetical protein AZF00_10075 [Zhongshania aliphaticivorans]|uniref:Uncharacterized protein n=1 Tax=Zhongshania aliphaticivorans TaxID=1470434 RepID=A0A127M5U2_9GAMM|nr:hypothetical protein AZF00_10075 [Zhongshania aliphaticivorans]
MKLQLDASQSCYPDRNLRHRKIPLYKAAIRHLKQNNYEKPQRRMRYFQTLTASFKLPPKRAYHRLSAGIRNSPDH